MNKRIVVGVDHTRHSLKAVDVAIARALHHQGVVIGVGFVDLPGLERANTLVAPAAAFVAHKMLASHRAEMEKRTLYLLEQFIDRCRTAGVDFETKVAEGRPDDGLFELSLTADLVVLGTRTHFAYESKQMSDDTLSQMVSRRVCPVLAVPPDVELPVPNVLFPYDGSAAAARALRLFVYLTPPLAADPNLVLLCVTDDEKEGQRLLDGPARFLEGHGHKVTREVVAGSPKKVVVRRARELQPGVVVLGAQGQGRLRERVFGSVSKRLIEDGSLPLFLTA